MSLDRRFGPLTAKELKEQRELFKSLREKIKQLRMPPVELDE